MLYMLYHLANLSVLFLSGRLLCSEGWGGVRGGGVARF